MYLKELATVFRIIVIFELLDSATILLSSPAYFEGTYSANSQLTLIEDTIDLV